MEFRWKGTKHRLYGSKGSRPKQKESQHENDLHHRQNKRDNSKAHISHQHPQRSIIKGNTKKFIFEDKDSLK